MIKITRSSQLRHNQIITLEVEVEGSLESELTREKILNQIRMMDLLMHGKPTTSKEMYENLNLELPTVTAEDIQEDMTLYPET